MADLARCILKGRFYCNAVCCQDIAFACGDVHYALAINQYGLLRIGIW